MHLRMPILNLRMLVLNLRMPVLLSSIMHAQKFCQMRGVKHSKFWNVIKGLGMSGHLFDYFHLTKFLQFTEFKLAWTQ